MSRRRDRAIVNYDTPRTDGRSLRGALLQYFGYASTTVPFGRLRVNVDGTNANVAIGWNNFDGWYRLSTGVVIYASNGSPAVLFANGVSLADVAEFRWAPNGNLPGSHQANLMDVGVGRSAPGILKVSGGDVSVRGAIQIGDPGARPAAGAAYRGTLWIEEGGAGVGDVVYLCVKDAADAYSWVAIADTSALLLDHNTRHEAGGADAIKLDDLAAPDDNTDLNASTTKHGLLLKLSNVATQFLNGQGGWTQPAAGPFGTQTSSSTGTVNDFDVTTGRNGYVYFTGASALTLTGFKVNNATPAEGDWFIAKNDGTSTVRIASADAGSTAAHRVDAYQSARGQILGVGGSVLCVYLAGSINRWRMTLLDPGEAIPIAFAAGNFTGSGSMTWTVDSLDVTTHVYQQRGDMVTVTWAIHVTTVGGTLSDELRIAMPNSFTSAAQMWGTLSWLDDNATPTTGSVFVEVSETLIRMFRTNLANFSAATNATAVAGTITFKVD